MVGSNLTAALHHQQHADGNQVIPHSTPSLPGGSELRIPDPPPLSVAHVQTNVEGLNPQVTTCQAFLIYPTSRVTYRLPRSPFPLRLSAKA